MSSISSRASPENLVLVAAHAIYAPVRALSDPALNETWFLQDFQRGEPPFYAEHVRRGVELAARDNTLLVFSGGQTRIEAGPRSEADGYHLLAEAFCWWGHEAVAARAALEEFARDSFENLLFGLCRFYEVAARFPARVTVVSWAFKRERFGMHRAALRFPAERFAFEGTNDPADLESARRGERHTIELFRRDPYGAHAPLADKRRARDPFRRHHAYESRCPPLAGLLRHRGPEIYGGPLPY